jgi:hypothetical protein
VPPREASKAATRCKAGVNGQLTGGVQGKAGVVEFPIAWLFRDPGRHFSAKIARPAGLFLQDQLAAVSDPHPVDLPGVLNANLTAASEEIGRSEDRNLDTVRRRGARNLGKYWLNGGFHGGPTFWAWIHVALPDFLKICTDSQYQSRKKRSASGHGSARYAERRRDLVLDDACWIVNIRY